MKKKLIYSTIAIITTLIIYLFFFKQSYEEKLNELSKHVIFYDKNLKLNFSDFNTTPDSSSESEYYYYFGFILKNTPVDEAHAISFFDKNQSWVKDSTKLDRTIEIELMKTRFDLIELYTQIINQQIDSIKNLKSTTSDSIYNISSQVYEKYRSEKNKLEDDIHYSNKYVIEIISPKLRSILKSNKNINNYSSFSIFERNIKSKSISELHPRCLGNWIQSNSEDNCKIKLKIYDNNKASIINTNKITNEYIFRVTTKNQVVLKYHDYDKIYKNVFLGNDTIKIEKISFIKEK